LPIGVSGVSVKEVVEMIESRIPGGRYVISILLCLLILTASGVYLYHALVLPMVLGVSSVITTGRIPSTTWGALVGSAIGGVILAFAYSYIFKKLLKGNELILSDYRKFADSFSLLLDNQDAIGLRLNAIESRVSALEQ